MIFQRASRISSAEARRVALDVHRLVDVEVRELLARPSVLTCPGVTSSVSGCMSRNRCTSESSSVDFLDMISSKVLRLVPLSFST
jgi:hypothetical protein